MISTAIDRLVAYALERGLLQPEDKTWAINTILQVLQLDSWDPPEDPEYGDLNLADILSCLLDDAAQRGVLQENSIVYRDLFDTLLMGQLTPRPSQVINEFFQRYRQSPQAATDWYYRFSQDTNYIRRDRIARDLKWTTDTEYGALDVTINLSKPEKDPKAIAAARNLPTSSYPKCQLCMENEGYAGRVNHPARENLRTIPITIHGAPWFLQYSPYVYYQEHCIVFNRQHTPMKIDAACFSKLLDFVRQFPHYFVGSNADLPIVGGSILAHDHFQGGHYCFPMERASVETPVFFKGFDDISAGIVHWPMSVIRITGANPDRLAFLANRILQSWRSYSDSACYIFAETDGTPHNTITPIARRRGTLYELDLVLRNNITTPEHPLGLYHPHQELHHIKKENIGLIEVMGLAVLPARLKEELTTLSEFLISGKDLYSDPRTEKHADWAENFRRNYSFTAENALPIVLQETGKVFAKVLEHAGVYARTPQGKEGFLRFLEQV